MTEGGCVLLLLLTACLNLAPFPTGGLLGISAASKDTATPSDSGDTADSGADTSDSGTDTGDTGDSGDTADSGADSGTDSSSDTAGDSAEEEPGFSASYFAQEPGGCGCQSASPSSIGTGMILGAAAIASILVGRIRRD